MKKIFTFLLLLPFLTNAQNPGETFANAIEITTKSTINISTLAGYTSSGLQPVCFTSPVKKDIWFKFNVGITGTLEFTGTPLAAGEFDYCVFDVTSANPSNTATPVACNYNFSQSTTFPPTPVKPHPFGLISSASTISDSAKEYLSPITVLAGHTYAIMVDNYYSDNTGFTLKLAGTFDFASPTSLNDFRDLNRIEILPNPVNEKLNIFFELKTKSIVNIEIIDILGESKGKLESGYFEGTYKNSWNIQEMKPGIYFLNMQIGETFRVKKILIQ